MQQEVMYLLSFHYHIIMNYGEEPGNPVQFRSMPAVAVSGDETCIKPLPILLVGRHKD